MRLDPPPVEVALLNLSAERCCVLARNPFAARSGDAARLNHGEECFRAEILWAQAELAALEFHERLCDTMFNRLTAALFLNGIAFGNPHASEREVTRTMSPEVRRAHWHRWSTSPSGARVIFSLTGDKSCGG